MNKIKIYDVINGMQTIYVFEGNDFNFVGIGGVNKMTDEMMPTGKVMRSSTDINAFCSSSSRGERAGVLRAILLNMEIIWDGKPMCITFDEKMFNEMHKRCDEYSTKNYLEIHGYKDKKDNKCPLCKSRVIKNEGKFCCAWFPCAWLVDMWK